MDTDEATTEIHFVGEAPEPIIVRGEPATILTQLWEREEVELHLAGSGERVAFVNREHVAYLSSPMERTPIFGPPPGQGETSRWRR